MLFGGRSSAAAIIRSQGAPPRAVEIARGLARKDRTTLGALKRGLFGQALEALTQPLPDWLAPLRIALARGL